MTALATESGRKTPARLAGSAILACQSDERLVELVRSGHERAFDAIVERYRKPLVRYCLRILPESRCEDAVQQALINAHAALLASDEQVQLKPWLYAITRNAALNMLRQNGWNYEPIPLDFDGVRRPDQVVEQRAELQHTVAALQDLPDRQRDALVMREFEGRSYDEIALALDTGDGAVRQLLNRARVTLRNAATLLTPPPLVARAVSSMPPSDGRRIAEVFGALGTAGVAKAGATALVAGSLVVGALEAPLPLKNNDKPTREKATLVPATDPPARAHDTPVVLHPSAPAPRTPHAPAVVRKQSQHSNSGPSTPTRERETEQRESSERERSGGSDDSRTRERSGSDGSPTSGSGDHSGPGGGGSDDVVTTLGTADTSGTSGTSGEGTSGTSGSDDFTTTGTSGSSGSGSSGSGISGSGSDDSLTSGSGTSGSTSSGSGSSGSSDTLEH
jgi:RNA polymerase sigma factor (sigma-70 family)